MALLLYLLPPSGATSRFVRHEAERERLEDLQQLEEPKRQTLFDLMDTYIRDAKARRAYAS